VAIESQNCGSEILAA